MIAQSIIDDARRLLLDETGIYYSDTKLLSLLNQGQRQIVSDRPVSGVKTVVAQLQPGCEQVLPSDARQLVDVPRNLYSISVPALPNISIAALNASQNEGNSGTTNFTFTVSRDTAVGVSSVQYAVGGTGTHPANATDFVGGAFPTGTVSWVAGEVSKTITIPVQGDVTNEYDETFQVVLNTPTNGTIAVGSAIGTIINDEPGYAYITYSNDGLTSSVAAIDINTNTLYNLSSGLPQLNCLAWSEANSTLYVLIAATGHLGSIDHLGALTDLGAISGFTIGTANGGTVDPNGFYWLGFTGSTTMYKVNLATKTVVATVTLPIAMPGADFDFDPSSGILYTVNQTTLYAFNLTLGTYQTWTISGLLAVGYNAWIVGDTMYALASDNGAGASQLFKFNYRTAGAATSVLTSSIFLAADGARVSPTFLPV